MSFNFVILPAVPSILFCQFIGWFKKFSNANCKKVLSQTISNKNGNQCSVDSVHCSFLRLSENFSGAATVPFSREIIQVLMSPINENDVEIKPDGKTTCGEISFNFT